MTSYFSLLQRFAHALLVIYSQATVDQLTSLCFCKQNVIIKQKKKKKKNRLTLLVAAAVIKENESRIFTSIGITLVSLHLNIYFQNKMQTYNHLSRRIILSKDRLSVEEQIICPLINVTIYRTTNHWKLYQNTTAIIIMAWISFRFKWKC